MSFSPEPVNEAKVQSIADDFKSLIDDDVEDILIHSEAIQRVWERLTNDERSEVRALLSDKAPDSGPRGRMYKSILSDLIMGANR